MAKTDLEIAQECVLESIDEIAKKAGIDLAANEPYGRNKAKVDLNVLDLEDRKDGKLILVSAINPSKAGVG